MIRTEQEASILTLILDRPEALNAFDAAGYTALAVALRKADADPTVSVIVLTGAGRAFTVGADRSNWEPAHREAVLAGFTDAVRALVHLSKPLVGAVHGHAVGFGATLLGHADIVVIADDAQVTMPFGELGTVPEAGSTSTFPKLLGHQRAFWVLLGGATLSGRECVDIGLALESCSAADVLELARARAADLAKAPVAVLQATKRLLNHGQAALVEAALARELAEAQNLSDGGHR